MLTIPTKQLFSYDLGIKIIASKIPTEELTICCHGYGHNRNIINALSAHHVLSGNLLGFNFPDHDINAQSDYHLSTFGTLNEILPLLYLLKFYACDLNLPIINLYGLSAGGGAIINALAILNQYTHADQLQKIGITLDHAKQILAIVENSQIILDCPLKSVAEIIAFSGNDPEFVMLAERYTKNQMNPIDALSLLAGLKLNILLHFQNPDEILGNRDDNLFIQHLQTANRNGKTTVIIGHDGGHNVWHTTLWHKYQELHKA